MSLRLESLLSSHATPEAALASLLQTHNELVTRHTELQGQYERAVSDRDLAETASSRAADENLRLWRQLKTGGSPKLSSKSRQTSNNVAGAAVTTNGFNPPSLSTSASNLTNKRSTIGASGSQDRLGASTPPNLFAPTNAAISPLSLRIGSTSAEELPQSSSSLSGRAPGTNGGLSLARENGGSRTGMSDPFRLPGDTVSTADQEFLSQMPPLSPFFIPSPDLISDASPPNLTSTSPRRSISAVHRRSQSLGLQLGTTALDIPALLPSPSSSAPDTLSLLLAPSPILGQAANFPPLPSPSNRRPTLSPSFLQYTRLRVAGSTTRVSEKGKESICLTIEVVVDIASDESSEGGVANWSVEKSYRDLVGLESAVKVKVQRLVARRISPFPDKALFKDSTPAKVDSRQTIVQLYLQSLIPIELARDALCAFLNTDVVDEHAPPTASGAGWLTKRGRSFGLWHTRYYVLSRESDTLSYFDSVGGTKLGEINIAHAAIGKQSSKTATADYRHAFLVRTPKSSTGEAEVDTILCAASDEARDIWIEALTSTSTRGRAYSGGEQIDEKEKEKEREREKKKKRRASHPLPPMISMTAARDAPSASLGTSFRSRDTLTASATAINLPDLDNLPSPSDRSPSPMDGTRPSGTSKLVASNVSGPTNAAPLPSGYDFKSGESLKDREAKKLKAKTSSFWGFTNRSAQGAEKNAIPSPPATPPAMSFGVPLALAVSCSPLSPSLHLPAVVYRCIEFLNANNAVSEEGIFRLSGSTNVIRTLKDRFNNERDVDLIHSANYYDIHAIAGLLKTFLRELPTPILTRELQPSFVAILELDLEERQAALRAELGRLPIENFSLIEFLFTHLATIADNSEVNKMGIRNLAIVISPSLAIPAPLFTLLLATYAKSPQTAVASLPSLSTSSELVDSSTSSFRAQPSLNVQTSSDDSPSLHSLQRLGEGDTSNDSKEVLLPPRSPGLPNSPRDAGSPRLVDKVAAAE